MKYGFPLPPRIRIRDSGEPGLDGWLIELLDARTGEVIARMMTASVDSNGDGMIDAEREAQGRV